MTIVNKYLLFILKLRFILAKCCDDNDIKCSANTMKLRVSGIACVWHVLVTLSKLWVASGDSCAGRKIYNAMSGIITDGTGDYPISAHCEWLIEGQYVMLPCTMHRYFRTLRHVQRSQPFTVLYWNLSVA